MLIQVIRTPADVRPEARAAICRLTEWIMPVDAQRAAGVARVARRIARRVATGLLRLDAAAAADLTEPLAQLQALGHQVVLIVTPGAYVVRAESGLPLAIPLVGKADYIVAPDPCYFRRGDAAEWRPIHLLGAECPTGHAEIVEDGSEANEKVFDIWWTIDVLYREFEFDVPWCPTCLEQTGSAA